MVPEYALHGQLSVKAGILLLEHATGRKNTYYKLLPEMQTLLEWILITSKWNSAMSLLNLLIMNLPLDNLLLAFFLVLARMLLFQLLDVVDIIQMRRHCADD